MDPELRDHWLEQAKARLATSGRHAGAARTAVLTVLASDGQCLLEASEIIDRLRAQQVGSAASVYRILQDLLEMGLLNRLDGRDGVARYEIVDPGHRHHHFIDDRSGAILAFHDELLDAAIQEAAQRLGIELASHELVLRGSRSQDDGTPDGAGAAARLQAAAGSGAERSGWGLRPSHTRGKRGA